MWRWAFPLLLAPAAHAQAGHTHVTELGRRVLAQSDQVVEASVVKVLPSFRGVTTARLKVTEQLYGHDRSPVLVLLFIEDYLAPDVFTATLDRATVRYERRRREGARRDDPDETGATAAGTRRETAPAGNRAAGTGVRLAEGEEGLFFLRRQGASYALVGFVPTRDLLYETKRARLGEVLRIEGIAAVDLRAEDAKRWFLSVLGEGNPWERGNTARELAGLAVRYPGLFTKEEGTRLAGALLEEEEPPIRSSLERAVMALDPAAGLAYAERAEAAATERHARALDQEREVVDATRMPELKAAELVRIARAYGRASTGLLAGYLADPEPLVRERAAQALAEHGGPSAREPLRRALAREADADAALAMIYACGVRADAEAVPMLAVRMQDRAFERAAIHALARVGTKDARKALESHRKRADATTQDLIDTLLREEFAERS